MIIDVLSLFPDFIENFSNWSMIGIGVEKNLFKLNSVNIRDFSTNKHKKVDDYPFGGGPGMVMTPDPIVRAINSVKKENSRVIYLSPQGRVLDQELALELSREEHLVLLCGHYEGIDNRVIENYIDEEISIGDYILTGGELPAMVLIDTVVRLLPGLLSSEESYMEESHYNGLLEHSQYTRPREYDGYGVPDVLLSGNHKEIEIYRKRNSLENTLNKRPDLLDNAKLDSESRKILEDIRTERNNSCKWFSHML